MADYVAHPEFCTCQSCVVDRAYEVVVDDYKAALADRDRRIEALVAEVDSWKASYMALAPDHDVAMLRANSRIEALTKALRELVEACTPLQLPSDKPVIYGVRMPEREVVDAGRAALASAAGAEGKA